MTIEITNSGETYYRTARKWAKVSKVKDRWYVAKGWTGSTRALRVFNMLSEELAVCYAKGWVGDE